MNTGNKNSLPKWIKKIQQQSWQIEILIASGLIIFLYNIPHYLFNFLIDYEESALPRAEPVILFFGAFIFSRALLLGFVATLFLRALWLAFLGINFAFPDGINFQKLSYSEFFKEKIEKSKTISERIISLEKICSLTYSITIMVTLFTAGMFVLLTVLYYGLYYLAPSFYDNPNNGIILLILIFLMMLGIVDWFFFGKMKRFKLISQIYYPLYKLFHWFTLSSFYQKEYLVFISNVNRWKVYGIFIIYFLLAFEITMLELSNVDINIKGAIPPVSFEERNFLTLPTLSFLSKRKYESKLNENNRIISSAIQSDIITGNFLRVFVVYLKKYDESLDSLFRKNNVKLKPEHRTMEFYRVNDSLIQKSFNEFFVLEIDDKKIENNVWYLEKHYKTGEYGFVSYVPVSDLPKGGHLLIIKFNRLRHGKFNQQFISNIPFFLE